MAVPTFNSFSLNDSNFITERIIFKGYAGREVIRANIARREGVKLLNTEFGEKEISIEGHIIASNADNLQTLVDGMKSALTTEEADLIVEAGRTFTATVKSLMIPDEHYSQSKAPFEASFICTKPYSVGATQSAVTPVVSGRFTFSGSVNISGTMFGRPILVYTPGAPTTGQSNITRLDIYHVPTGQTITVSGFGNGTNLSYANPVTVDFDAFTSTEGSTQINNSGSFPRWDIGTNQFTVTSVGRAFSGGSITIQYAPRYL
jgi:predicted phage tail component-like protein